MSDFTQAELIDIALSSPDWNVRSNAVEKITDEHALKGIFKNDSVAMVKIKAMRRIHDADFLCDECLNNPQGHVRRAILSHILDENLLEDDDLNSLLAHLTLDDPEDIVSQVACENLSADYQDVFVDVTKSQRDEKLRCEAISKITDENILRDLALGDENSFIRLEAIQNPNLADINILAEAIRNDEKEFNRISAILKIPDSDSLLEIIFDESLYPRLSEIAANTIFSPEDCFSEILMHDDDSYKRIVAVNFIQNEELLNDLVLNCDDDKVIAEAIKNPYFKNQEILQDLIRNEPGEDVVFEAICKIDDDNLLIDYVNRHLSSSNPTFKAISRITDIDFLREMYDCENQEIKLHAAKRMIELKYDLTFIASDSHDKEIRLEAIRAMSDKYMLATIASEAEDRDIAIAALDNIVPEKLISTYLPRRSIITGSLHDIVFKGQLWRLACENEDMEIRKVAISKLYEKEALDEIINDNLDIELVNAAQKRLDGLWQDIKLIGDEEVLKVIAQKGDDEIKSAVSAQIEDLKTWRNRIAKVNEMTDADQLKDIANNDYNYFVRCEAEGKLENLLFDVRLDEIGLEENQELFIRIANDETYPLEIRKKAGLMIVK